MTTATTPSRASARLVSMRLMRACGYGECRIFPTSMPGHAEIVSVLAGASSLLRRVDHRGGLADNGEIVGHDIWLIAHLNLDKLLGFRVPVEDKIRIFVVEIIYSGPGKLQQLRFSVATCVISVALPAGCLVFSRLNRADPELGKVFDIALAAIKPLPFHCASKSDEKAKMLSGQVDQQFSNVLFAIAIEVTLCD